MAGVCGPWIVRDPSSHEVMEASKKALAIYKAGSTKVVKLVKVKEAISHVSLEFLVHRMNTIRMIKLRFNFGKLN